MSLIEQGKAEGTLGVTEKDAQGSLANLLSGSPSRILGSNISVLALKLMTNLPRQFFLSVFLDPPSNRTLMLYLYPISKPQPK